MYLSSKITSTIKPNKQSGTTLNVGLHCLNKISMEAVRDLWLFMKERKKFWLLPIIVILLLLGILIVLGGSSAFAPFVYSLF